MEIAPSVKPVNWLHKIRETASNVIQGVKEAWTNHNKPQVLKQEVMEPTKITRPRIRVNKAKAIRDHILSQRSIFTDKMVFNAIKEDTINLTLTDIYSERGRLLKKKLIRIDHISNSNGSDVTYRVCGKRKNPGFNMVKNVEHTIYTKMGDLNLSFDIGQITLLMKQLYMNEAEFSYVDISSALSVLKKKGKLTSQMKGRLHVDGHIWGIVPGTKCSCRECVK